MTDPNFVSGGLNVRAQPLSRIELLERQVRSLQTQLDGLRSAAKLVHPHHVRLCRTRSDSTYPTQASGANAFEFVYLDLDFTETQGNNAGTLTELSSESQRVGKTVDDAYVPDETDCLAITLPNRKQLLVPLSFADSTCRIGIADETIARRTQGSYVLDHGQVRIYTVNASHTLVDTGETIEAYNATSSTVHLETIVLLADDASGRPLIVDHLSSARLAACSVRGAIPQTTLSSLPTTIQFGGSGTPYGFYSSESSNECYVANNAINFPANRGMYLVDWSASVRYRVTPTQDANPHYEALQIQPFFKTVGISGQDRWCSLYLPPLIPPGNVAVTNPDRIYASTSGQFAVVVDGSNQKVEFKIIASALALNTIDDLEVSRFSASCHAVGPGELAQLSDFSSPWRE